VSFDASDASGIAAVRLYVDGGQAQSSLRSCDFTYAKPCADVTAASFTLDTTELSNGSHTIQVAAVDAAGNDQRSLAQTITVNNASSSTGGGGGGAPVGGGGGGGGAAGSGVAPPEMPSTPNDPAPPVVTTPAPPSSTPPVRDERLDPSPRVRTSVWRHGTVRASGTLTRQATGSLTVVLERRIGGRLYRITKTVHLRHGRWSVAVRATDRLARLNWVTLRIAYPGNGRVKGATLRRCVMRY
jgi:hypothetical protein